MTPQQIKNKIAELEFWLNNNPHHTYYNVKLNEKKALELELMTLENPKKT